MHFIKIKAKLITNRRLAERAKSLVASISKKTLLRLEKDDWQAPKIRLKYYYACEHTALHWILVLTKYNGEFWNHTIYVSQKRDVSVLATHTHCCYFVHIKAFYSAAKQQSTSSVEL